MRTAPSEAAPGSQALAGGALRGAVLPMAHAEVLLLEEAVHAMLRSTMHQQAAKKGSQAYPNRCTILSTEQMGNVCWLATELRCACNSRGYLQALGCCFAGHMLSQTDRTSEWAPSRRTAAEYVTVQVQSACCRLGCHEIAQCKQPHHASEGFPADSAGVVHSCQADVGAVGNARVRWLCPDCALPDQLLADPALEAAGMPPAEMRQVGTPPSTIGSEDMGKSIHVSWLTPPI